MLHSSRRSKKVSPASILSLLGMPPSCLLGYRNKFLHPVCPPRRLRRGKAGIAFGQHLPDTQPPPTFLLIVFDKIITRLIQQQPKIIEGRLCLLRIREPPGAPPFVYCKYIPRIVCTPDRIRPGGLQNLLVGIKPRIR